jgi:hypothetical protein
MATLTDAVDVLATMLKWIILISVATYFCYRALCYTVNSVMFVLRWVLGLGPSQDVEDVVRFIAGGTDGNEACMRRRNRYRRHAPLLRRVLDHLIVKGLDPMMERRPDNIGVVRFEVSHFVQKLVREENLRLADAKVLVLLATEGFFVVDDDTIAAFSMQATHAAWNQGIKSWRASCRWGRWLEK